ncbi:MAG: aminotransferase class I/II-fold pyridoxal phosphate-dependent enzyme [Erysipelotrichales bacterium]|nr:aminotransferase class I/II-fold pyridoxal phosphate-dependent enzyme [Erysipelotrichales bacterium]
MKYRDFRSDTVTKPSKAMLETIFNYQYDDDVFEDDLTIKSLEKKLAGLLGKESALFVPSGTFSNQLALFVHAQRGEEVIVDQNSHIKVYESGASAVIAGVQLYTMESDNGYFDLAKLQSTISEGNIFTARTALICLENAYSGKVLSKEYVDQVCKIAHAKKIPVHLDGARLFNATTFLGISAEKLVENVDTVSICLSKGLGVPIGSMLVGSFDFIEKARLKRKLLGGGMRQVGILGAMGIYALDNNIKKLKIDHSNAAYLTEKLEKLSFVRINYKQRDINMVFCYFNHPKKGLEDFLLKHKIKILPADSNETYRFMTHLDIEKDDVDYLVDKINEFYGG